MAIFKCKMCGGTIDFEQGATVGVCDSCGTKQTLPRLDDDKKANLYDRANHFRRNNEYDKAMSIYEKILEEDCEDSEAYWSIILCRYGIEYVEDPATHKRVPTVNRAQFSSVVSDKDYKSALKYADATQKEIYKAEAKAIDNIQKGILEISSKEKPFDVFICYKETDNNGRRTQDSVIATELYHELTKEGFKVFFSRITLEDKLGQEYEPYIFAALNSSKLMVVLGTKPEYFDAVWVKNEWSRYLSLIKNGADKVLIPAYRDMDPYDLPEEFSHLQAQDMSKLGFMQDLIRGINKIISVDTPKPTVKETVVNNSNIAPLLKRAFMFLEDGEFERADEFCEQVLNQDPECAESYLGKLMAELKVRKREQLADCAQPFEANNNLQKAIRFGDEKLKTELKNIIKKIVERNEENRLNASYNNAVRAMNAAKTEDEYKSAANTFKSISGFKDTAALAEKCLEKAEISRKDAIYETAKSKMINDMDRYCFEEALKRFQSISSWKDADSLILECQQKIEECKAEEEAERLEAERKAEEKRIADEKAKKKIKKIAMIATPILCVLIVFIIILNTVIIPKSKYNKAMDLIDSGDYDSAILLLNGLMYKDSETQIENCYIGKYGEEKWNKIKNIKVGDTYTFGTYEQDNNTSNGTEAIEWTVLAKEGMSLLLISDKALDCQPYNTSCTDVTWETCTLRKWMNGTFFNNAFSTEEQAQIQSTTVTADDNPEYSTNPGNATTDKVFLLSITEAEKYFSSDEDRKCAPTEYAIAQGSLNSDSYTKGGAAWWLRSPGSNQDNVAGVFYDGSVYYLGVYVHGDDGCVRPALWIDIQ